MYLFKSKGKDSPNRTRDCLGVESHTAKVRSDHDKPRTRREKEKKFSR